MPLPDLNDLGSSNKRLGEHFSWGGMSSNRQCGREQDNGGDDRSKSEVMFGLPQQQQQKQTTGKKKKVNEDDKEPLVVKGQWTIEEDRLRLEKHPFLLASSSSSIFFFWFSFDICIFSLFSSLEFRGMSFFFLFEILGVICD